MATLDEKKIRKRSREKLKLAFIITLIEIAISPVIVYAIHQLFSWLGEGIGEPGSLHIDWNYPVGLQLIITNEKVRIIWIALQLLWIAFLLYLFASIKPVVGKVDQMKVTDDIYIPVPAGNGQHGAERFLTEEEKKEKFSIFEFTGKEVPTEKGGVVVQMTKHGKKEVILYVSEDVHTIIVAATRAGKTRRVILLTIFMQLLSGVSVFCSDVKGELFYYTSAFARELGYDVLPLDFINPSKSVHINFLQSIIDAKKENDIAKAIDYTWDLVSVLVGQQKGEPLWYNGETASIAASILCVVCDAPEEYQNLTNVYYFLAEMCEPDAFGNIPLNTYLNDLPETHPARGVFKMATLAAQKTRSSFFTSALGTLRLFTNPHIAEMTSYSDFSLKDLGRKKTILYAMIPDEKKTLYSLVSALVNQLYVLQVEVARENGGRLPIDTDYDLDEVGNFPVIPVMGNILSAGASRGIRANLVVQDYQQFESKYKEDFKNIKTNCQCKIYLKSDDKDTLKDLSDNLGPYTVEVSSASASAQDGKNSNVNYSSSASLTGRPLLQPAELKRFKSPYALCLMTGEYGSVNILPDISEYRANKLFGLGNKKHNIELIKKREAERESHPIGELKLWGVWNKYKNSSGISTENQTGENKERISFL